MNAIDKHLSYRGRAALGLALALAACDQPGGRAVTASGDATTTTTTTAGDAATAPEDTATSPSDTAGGTPVAVDPRCVDGQFDEAPPDDAADIRALVAGYSEGDVDGFVKGVLAARYPFGRTLVEAGLEAQDCIANFTSDVGTAQGVIGDLSTVVHECGHLADLTRAGFSSSVFLVNADVDFQCPSVAAQAGKSFARSLLNDDPYAALLPGDFYRDVYLDGDPTNSRFESGDQGYDSVLEETTQYVNSLVTDWAFRDQRARGTSISARDGILTFLWYTERYLRLARLEHPEVYQRIASDRCWREATLTIWGRAWLYLDASSDDPGLGLDDDAIMSLVMDPDLLSEIARLRQAHGCP